jgi:hypothetical protein
MLGESKGAMLDSMDRIYRIDDVQKADFGRRPGKDASPVDPAHTADELRIAHQFQYFGKIILWNSCALRDDGSGQRLIAGLREPYGSA